MAVHERPEVAEVPSARQQDHGSRSRGVERSPVERRRMDDGVHPNAELGQHGELTEPDQRVAGVVVQRGADEDDVAQKARTRAERWP